MINFLTGLQTRQEDQPFDSLIVCGPELAPSQRAQVERRAADCAHVRVAQFVEDMRGYMDCADVVVAMGGYNTFCEILSFDKPALLVPRKHPRREQLVRAQRAAELGVVDVIDSDAAGDPTLMARAIRVLLERPRPSEGVTPLDLDGLERIGGTVERFVSELGIGQPVLEPA